jgi:hypothetical protein
MADQDCRGATARGLGPHHEPHVFSRRRWCELWRKTWWVHCMYCPAESGPYATDAEARKVVAAHYEAIVCMWHAEDQERARKLRGGFDPFDPNEKARALDKLRRPR